jgi:hypothetical protein
MPTIAAQLRKLEKKITIPYVIRFVDKVVEPANFDEKVIYVHIWI